MTATYQKRPPAVILHGMTEEETKDVGALLDAILKEHKISQYALAQEMAEIRGTNFDSQEQAVRRIRRLGQLPTAEVAADLATALNNLIPKLRLPPEYFFQTRAGPTLRDLVEDALEEIQRLKAKVAALEKAQGKKQAAAPKRQGSSRKRTTSR